jgi:hypothetical protein
MLHFPLERDLTGKSQVLIMTHQFYNKHENRFERFCTLQNETEQDGKIKIIHFFLSKAIVLVAIYNVRNVE